MKIGTLSWIYRQLVERRRKNKSHKRLGIRGLGALQLETRKLCSSQYSQFEGKVISNPEFST